MNSERKKAPLYAKLLLSFISLIFFLSILEVGLWVYGLQYYEPDEVYRTDEFISAKATGDQNAQNIIAVGDSFTHGGLVEGNETYTSFLRSRLKMNKLEYIRIYNKGICELNTHELLKRFPKLISKYNPKAVLLLVGATNRFNPWDYEAYANNNVITSFVSWLSDLRVVKMMRFIKLNIAAKSKHDGGKTRSILFNNLSSARSITSGHDLHLEYIETMEEINQPDQYSLLNQAWYHANTGELSAAIDVIEKGLKENQVSHIEGVFSLAEFYFKNNDLKRTEQILNAEYKQDPESERILNSIIYYTYKFANWYKDKLQYDLAIEYYLKAIAIEPDVDYFYFEMNKLYALQSNYDSNMMYSKLKNLTETNPLLSLSQMYTNHLKLYKDKQKWEAGIEQWIYDDLNEIAKLCKKNNITLIIQNYPTDYVMANRVLSKIATEYNLPFVDHQAVFDGLEPKERYFFDDDHCTKLGHHIMSKNIYQTMIDAKVINM